MLPIDGESFIAPKRIVKAKKSVGPEENSPRRRGVHREKNSINKKFRTLGLGGGMMLAALNALPPPRGFFC
jgi:hypothetical protein